MAGSGTNKKGSDQDRMIAATSDYHTQPGGTEFTGDYSGGSSHRTGTDRMKGNKRIRRKRNHFRGGKSEESRLSLSFPVLNDFWRKRGQTKKKRNVQERTNTSAQKNRRFLPREPKTKVKYNERQTCRTGKKRKQEIYTRKKNGTTGGTQPSSERPNL